MLSVNTMIYLLNYADGEPYESYRKVNTKTAYLFGKVDKVLEYSSKDIPQTYKDEHKEIFAYKRGAGLWLWKPYIILDALGKCQEGDWLFYCDSGATLINKISCLIDCAIANNVNIFLVEQPLLEKQFTKRETCIGMSINDIDQNQLLSGYILLKKCAESVMFIKEWQLYCERIDLLSPERFHNDIGEWNTFYSHREDQSILSLLRYKWKLPAFRDPSDYGEMPFMYASKDRAYNPKVYSNSDYPTIILCNRKAKPLKYAFMYIIKRFLNRIGLYYTEEHLLKKRNITKYNANLNFDSSIDRHQ